MPTATDTVSTSTRPPAKNVSRERRKAERVALAGLVAELEQRLQQLHACSVARPKPASKPQDITSSSSGWRHVAVDESRKRRLAEYTNQQLRKARRRQERALMGLVKVYLRTKTPASNAVPARRLHDANGRRFAILLEEVESAFRDLDLVFADSNAGNRGEEGFTTTLTQSINRGKPRELVLEARRTSTIAVDLARCGRALWTASQQLAQSSHLDACIS